MHAHQQLMNILNGGGSSYGTANGSVTLNLQPIVGPLGSTLSSRTNGAVTLPANAGTVTILQSDQLSTAQTLVKLMKLLAIPMFLAALAVLAIAIVISHDRRRTFRVDRDRRDRRRPAAGAGAARGRRLRGQLADHAARRARSRTGRVVDRL